MISIGEIDLPDKMNQKMSRLYDYPPRIVVDLSPNDLNPMKAVLEVMGLNRECFFSITGMFDSTKTARYIL